MPVDSFLMRKYVNEHVPPVLASARQGRTPRTSRPPAHPPHPSLQRPRPRSVSRGIDRIPASPLEFLGGKFLLPLDGSSYTMQNNHLSVASKKLCSNLAGRCLQRKAPVLSHSIRELRRSLDCRHRTWRALHCQREGRGALGSGPDSRRGHGTRPSASSSRPLPHPPQS